MKPFKTIGHLQQSYPGFVWPRPYTWRILPLENGEITYGTPGSINALDMRFTGLALASNGPLIFLETPLGPVIGHKDWFIPDHQNQDLNSVVTKRKTKLQERMDEYV
jgi:hypothetical protein